MSSLGTEFPVELARARELLGVYRDIGPAGSFGAVVIEGAIRTAEQALASGDVVAMLRSYEELKGLK